MDQYSKPDKQAVRDWLTKAISEKKPPAPTIEQVRRELGWGLVAKNGNSRS